ESVHVVLEYPEERILHKVGAHALAPGLIVIDGLAPGGFMMRGEIGTEEAEIISLVTQMVVDYVEDHAQAGIMRRVYQALKSIRAAIARLHGIGRDAVITPVVQAGEGRDRHDLNHSN